MFSADHICVPPSIDLGRVFSVNLVVGNPVKRSIVISTVQPWVCEVLPDCDAAFCNSYSDYYDYDPEVTILWALPVCFSYSFISAVLSADFVGQSYPGYVPRRRLCKFHFCALGIQECFHLPLLHRTRYWLSCITHSIP